MKKILPVLFYSLSVCLSGCINIEEKKPLPKPFNYMLTGRKESEILKRTAFIYLTDKWIVDSGYDKISEEASYDSKGKYSNILERGEHFEIEKSFFRKKDAPYIIADYKITCIKAVETSMNIGLGMSFYLNPSLRNACYPFRGKIHNQSFPKRIKTPITSYINGSWLTEYNSRDGGVLIGVLNNPEAWNMSLRVGRSAKKDIIFCAQYIPSVRKVCFEPGDEMNFKFLLYFLKPGATKDIAGEVEKIRSRFPELKNSFKEPEIKSSSTLLADNKNFIIWGESSLRKVFRDTKPPKAKTGDGRILLHMAKNEYEPYQLVITPEKNIKLSDVRSSDLGAKNGNIIPASNISINLEKYIDVKTVNSSHGIAGPTPDILMPMSPFEARKNTNYPLWITVYVPKNAVPGIYEGRITLVLDQENVEIPLRVKVWDFSLPDISFMKTYFNTATGKINNIYKGSKKRRDIYSKLIENTLSHKINVCTAFGYNPKIMPDGTLKVHFEEPDKQLSYYEKRGANMVRFPLPLFRNTRQKNGGARFLGYKAGTPEHEKYLKSFLSQVREHFKEKGWLDKSFARFADEPSEGDVEAIRSYYNQIKKTVPEVPLSVSLHRFGAMHLIKGAVDIWDCTYSNYQEKFFEDNNIPENARWFYFAGGTKYPFPNPFPVCSRAIESRIVPWKNWKYKVPGLHHYLINDWNKQHDPWTGAYLKNRIEGIGILVYPGQDGPVNSIRWEIIRDGLEDYDYLKILESEIKRCKSLEKNKRCSELDEAGKTLEKAREFTGSLGDFPLSPSELMNMRTQIGNCIENLKKIH